MKLINGDAVLSTGVSSVPQVPLPIVVNKSSGANHLEQPLPLPFPLLSSTEALLASLFQSQVLFSSGEPAYYRLSSAVTSVATEPGASNDGTLDFGEKSPNSGFWRKGQSLQLATITNRQSSTEWLVQIANTRMQCVIVFILCLQSIR